MPHLPSLQLEQLGACSAGHLSPGRTWISVLVAARAGCATAACCRRCTQPSTPPQVSDGLCQRAGTAAAPPLPCATLLQSSSSILQTPASQYVLMRAPTGGTGWERRTNRAAEGSIQTPAANTGSRCRHVVIVHCSMIGCSHEPCR